MSTPPKYKVGEFLEICQDNADNKRGVLVKIVAAISESTVPLYGLTQYMKPEIGWFSEYEVAEANGVKHPGPDLKSWANVEVGDLVECSACRQGSTTSHIHTVMARQGDLVMVSSPPQTEGRELLKSASKLAEQLEELSDGEIDLSEEVKRAENALKTRRPLRNSHKVAAHEWLSYEKLAYLNWRVVSEREESVEDDER